VEQLSSLKGWVLLRQFVLLFSSLSASVRAALGEGRRSRRSARSVARTNGLDRGPARRRLVAARGERCVNSVVGAGLQCDVCGGQAECLGWRSSLRPGVRAWSGARATRGVNQNRGRAAFSGPDNCPIARVLRSRCSCRRPLAGQGPDVPVAQPVVDEGEQLAGRGDLGDVLAAAAGVGWPPRPPTARVWSPAW